MVRGDPFVDAAVSIDFFETRAVEVLVVSVGFELESIGVWHSIGESFSKSVHKFCNVVAVGKLINLVMAHMMRNPTAHLIVRVIIVPQLFIQESSDKKWRPAVIVSYLGHGLRYCTLDIVRSSIGEII